MIRRREFITLLGGAAAWPQAARAQQSAMPLIGFLDSASPGPYARFVAAFRQGLAATGYAEDRNVAIDFRWAEGDNHRLPTLAANLVRRQPSVIAATSISAALAVKAATATIPIVFRTGADPVQLGLVRSLNRPSGNLTGVTSLNVEVGPKRLELMHELVPRATSMALLVNPTNPRNAETTSNQLRAAARSRNLQLHVLHASTERDIDTAIAEAAELHTDGLVVGPDAFFLSRSNQLVEQVARHGIRAIYFERSFVSAGGLLSYGGNQTDAWHQTGGYVGRILNGDKPEDLPVHQATRVELVINLNAAKSLGLGVPPTLLARADEVIE